MLKYLRDPTLASLRKEIRDAKGIVDNFLNRMQVIFVGVIEHDAAHGDCTLAVDAINTLPTAEQRRWATQFLAYFGAIGIDAEKGKAINAKHIDPRSTRYHPRDVEGAKANMFFEPESGGWFKGPARDLYVPGTLGDVAENVVRFGDNLAKRLDGEKDRGDGVKVPIFALTAEQRATVDQVLVGVKRLGALLGASANKVELEKEIEHMNALIKDSETVLTAITKNEKKADTTADEAAVEATGGNPETVAA